MTTRIRAGDLTRLISIQQRATTTDGFGQQLQTWSELKKVYALIEALQGNERLAAQSISSEVSHRITVRYDAIFVDPRVVAQYRAVYNGRVFNIQACLNVDEGDRMVELTVSEGLNDG
jgi:SPP1 family predicted phage head-tail adaptor